MALPARVVPPLDPCLSTPLVLIDLRALLTRKLARIATSVDHPSLPSLDAGVREEKEREKKEARGARGEGRGR